MHFFRFLIFMLMVMLAKPSFGQHNHNWQAFELEALLKEQQETGKAYLPFLDTSTLKTGLYTLAPGTTDRQQAHTENEIYYVLSGKASIVIDGINTAIQTGSLLFVKAGVAHHFHAIEETLTLLVIFDSQ